MKRGQPNADTVGKELESRGYVKFDGKKFVQTSKNCFEIAQYLAEMFGYKYFPRSNSGLTDAISHNKQFVKGEDKPWLYDMPSEACFVIRTPDHLLGLISDVHVVFEFYGKEYNYGAGTKDGFTIERRIYVKDKKFN